MTTAIDRSGCPGSKHGTFTAAKNHGCSCADARELRRIRETRLRFGRQPTPYVDATGTRRRLEALAALGWSSVDIGTRMGYPAKSCRSLINQWRHPRSGKVHRSTAEKVDRVFEQLSGTPGPSTRIRVHAGQSGWAPPLAWEEGAIDDPKARPKMAGPRSDLPDDVLVERVVAGNAPLDVLRPRHRTIVVERLSARGWSVRRIARHLQVPERTIERHLARARQKAAAAPWADLDTQAPAGDNEGLVA